MIGYVRLKKDEYDSLCDEIRHLQTLSKLYDNWAKKMLDLLSHERDEIVERTRKLELLLSNCCAVVLDCDSCLNREVCHGLQADFRDCST